MAIDFLQTALSTTDASSYTFSSQNFGVAESGRYIAVSAIARKAGASFTLSSVTVGGVSATIVKQATNTVTNSNAVGIVIASVPTGTSGNVVVTWSTTVLRCAIGMWRITDLASITPYDSESSTAADPSVSLDFPIGYIIGAGTTGASTSATWSLLTKDYDSVVESYSTYTGAADEYATASNNRTLTIDFGSSNESVGVFVSWSKSSSSIKDVITTGLIVFSR